MVLASRLREIRGRAGLSQRQMAGRLGMKPNTYQRLELGGFKYQQTTLCRLDDAMIAAGFEWQPGEAAAVGAAVPADEILARLDRIEAYMYALFERLVSLQQDTELIDDLRKVLDHSERRRVDGPPSSRDT